MNGRRRSTSARNVAQLLVTLILVGACAGGGGAGSTGLSASPPAPAPATSGAYAGGGGGSLGGTVAAGGDLCGLLGPGDFAAAGVTGASVPEENIADANDAYCVYSGDSAATGGIEFDAFVAASKTDSQGTFAAASEGILDLAGLGKAAFPDADDAKLRTDIPGPYAGISIWKGKLVFDIGIPRTDKAKDQLIALARLVFQRAAALT